ncbi:hypothetical protein NHX12_012587 [Muraenolepis orangiensis]|uniref:YTH domain-containing family protein n=1 Tax=Muraenolepis orangiensis TaxID=630683 RepID=A0A9Q0DEF6_9TELE|nr:hypothetical protein NHX12_012587 [Muraenolepis orangiensis]
MMSAASIDPQTSKGQDGSKAFPVSVQNGSMHQKDTVHDNDFEPYLTGQSNQNNSYQSMTDPYLSSYYAPSIGFPYPLSNGGTSIGMPPPKPTSWAAIASKPAKMQQLKTKTKPGMPMAGGALPPPPIKHTMEIDTWDNKGTVAKQSIHSAQSLVQQMTMQGPHPPPPQSSGPGLDSHPVLEKLRAAHSYNPKDFDWNVKNGRVFIIKSYSEDDIHRSIKYSIWCSTEHGNKRLDSAFRAMSAKGPVYLLFSVNGSGHFCGVAEMRSPVDYGTSAGVWAQDKWKGKFDVIWLFVKDVPNSQLRHIRLENNDNKPVTNSRDTQEVPLEKAKQVLKIIATYKHTTSIFDDFSHYEKKQEEEEVSRKSYEPPPMQSRPRLDQDRQNRSKQ